MKTLLQENKAWIHETWDKIDAKMQKVCIRSRDKLPCIAWDNVHDDHSETQPSYWTNGFWPGMMWLMYLGTGNEEYKTTAVRGEELLDKALENYKVLHHDVGFMWHISSVANYRITGNKASCNKGLYLASTLFSRYNIEGRYIRAWNNWSEKAFDLDRTRTIIDCMMNIPLLYWASNEIKDERFKKVAMAHADTTLRDHIREDGSVQHMVTHDIVTGEKVKIGDFPGQGYAEDSSWSRGVSWAVYGFAISYVHTKEQRYLDAAIKTADHFIREVKKTDYLPVVDFYAPAKPVYYDASSGMITACGLIEIAKALGGEQGKYYLNEAIKLLKAADAHFCDYDHDHDALVHKSTGSYPRLPNWMDTVEVPWIFGDFYFVEAMLKLKGCSFMMW